MNQDRNLQLDLNRILTIIGNGWKFIVLFVLGALAFGFLIDIIMPNTYKATTKFVVRSPMLYDRNQIFRQDFYQNKAVFGDEDDVDMILAYFHGDFYRIDLVDKLGLQQSMGDKAYPKLAKNLKLRRNDTRELELEYYDTDRNRAAQVASATRDLLEKKHTEYFTSYNNTLKEIVQQQLNKVEKNLNNIDDSIASYRDEYGLHDYLTPTRNKNDITNQKTGSKANINQLESLKNMVMEKDKLSEDRARLSSLLNEYSYGDSTKSFNTFFLLQDATAASASIYPKKILYYGAILIGALILSTLLLIGRVAIRKRG